MVHAQPPDEWTFLRPEEFDHDEEVERVSGAMAQAPEETAMHLEAPVSLVRDPGRTDVDVGAGNVTEDDLEVSAVYFDDEEPEGPGNGPDADADHEPDLEEILESQHYSFEPTDS
jgi:hypothetical protein